MPFQYRNTQNGITKGGEVYFHGVFYDNTTADCPASHRDPDGNRTGPTSLRHFISGLANGVLGAIRRSFDEDSS